MRRPEITEEMKNKVAKVLADCKKDIVIWDYTEYDEDKCRDGGCYWFNTQYYKQGGGWWTIAYGTSADFDWNPATGCFFDNSHESFPETRDASVVRAILSAWLERDDRIFVTVDGEAVSV